MPRTSLPSNWKEEIEQEILSNLKLETVIDTYVDYENFSEQIFTVLKYKDKELSRIQVK